MANQNRVNEILRKYKEANFYFGLLSCPWDAIVALEICQDLRNYSPAERAEANRQYTERRKKI